MFNKDDQTIVELTLTARMQGKVKECVSDTEMRKVAAEGGMAVWNQTLYIPSKRGVYCIQKDGPFVAGKYRCAQYTLGAGEVESVINNANLFYQCPERVLDVLCNKIFIAESSMGMGALKQHGVKPVVWDSSGTEVVECKWVQEKWITEEGVVEFPCTVLLEAEEAVPAIKALQWITKIAADKAA